MSIEEIIQVLEEYLRWRRESYNVGSKIRLKSDNQLHTITRVDDYDYKCPYQIDGKTWIDRDAIKDVSPMELEEALSNAIKVMKGE